jgi:uncharacterized protein YegP (UPF0339 family)
MSNYEIYQDNKDQWRWRLRANNGEIVAASEAYTREEDALRADAKRVSDEADVDN